MRLSILMTILAALVMTSCTTERVKPENRWEVTVKKDNDNRVWVAKADGSRQCEGPSDLTPKAAAEQLVKAGIPVFNARSGTDGKMHIMKCGAPSGKTVELEISESNLGLAKAHGFTVKTAAN